MFEALARRAQEAAGGLHGVASQAIAKLKQDPTWAGDKSGEQEASYQEFVVWWVDENAAQEFGAVWEGLARTDADAGGEIQPSDPAATAVQRLVAMGFDKAQSEAMLESTGGDAERAL